MAEICANCERKIGKLETPHVFKGEVVCVDCEKRLRSEESEFIDFQNKSIGREMEAETKYDPKLAQQKAAAARARSAVIRDKGGRKKMPPSLVGMFWVGLFLWIVPVLLLGSDAIGVAWLGAILCIGSVVIWTIIRAVRES